MPEFVPIDQQEKTPDNKGSSVSEIDKITDEIKLEQKKQELATLKAGFKSVDEYKKAIEYQAREASKLQTKEAELKQREMTIIEREIKNKQEAQHIVEVGKEYKTRWSAEDTEHKQIIQEAVKQLKELNATVRDLHPRYLTETARNRILQFLNPVMESFGMVTESLLIAPETHTNGNQTVQLRKANINCQRLYNWVQKESLYGLDFARWLYPILQNVNELLSVENDKLNINQCLIYMRAINIGILHLVEKYENSKDNKTDYTAVTNYLCQVSNSIEQLCGVIVNAR